MISPMELVVYYFAVVGPPALLLIWFIRAREIRRENANAEIQIINPVEQVSTQAHVDAEVRKRRLERRRRRAVKRKNEINRLEKIITEIKQ